MTVLTTIASLSKNGFGYATNTLNLGLGQYVTTFTITGGSSTYVGANKIMPDSTGNAYVVIANTMGIGKLDTTGNVLFQKTVANAFTGQETGGEFYNDQMTVDSTGNVYVGGYTNPTPPYSSILIKYNNTGNILWQRDITPNDGSSRRYRTCTIQIDNGDNPLVLMGNYQGTFTPNFPTSIVARYDSTGTLINQRKLLVSTSTLVYLGFDKTANNFIAVGYDNFSGTTTENYYCTYAASNTTTGNTIRKLNGSYGTGTAGTIVADSTHYYQIVEARELGSATIRSTIVKTNKSTSTVVYAKQITAAGTTTGLCTMRGLTIDNSGYLYIIGVGGVVTDSDMVVGKIEASTGNVIWLKGIDAITSTNTGNMGENPIAWSNGYIYFCTSTYNSATTSSYYSYWKLKDNGVLPNGNWQNYTVRAISSSLYSVNTSVGSQTDSPVTTTYANATPTYTANTSSYTTVQSAIP
jgi:hypothetical protein